jgi:hypothetical protein
MARSELDEHLETLGRQSTFSAIALRTAADLIERLPARPTPAEIDRVRSQSRAAQRSLRSTTQLLAQAAELLEHNRTQPEEAQRDEHHRRPARNLG